MTPMGERWRLGHRPALDGLRALCFGLVFLSHTGVAWARGGGFGVLVFFVLSGFLIGSLLMAEHDRTGRISMARFYGRRARRLLPALVPVFAATVLVTGAVGALPSAVFYFANWQWFIHGTAYSVLGPFGHFWSLSVEEQFYLAAPWLLAVALRRLRPGGIAAALIAMSAGALLVRLLTIHGPSTAHLLFGTHALLDQLAIGVLAAVLVRSWPDACRRWSEFLMPLAVLTLVVEFAIARPEAPGAFGVLTNTLLPTLTALAAGVLILHVALAERSPVARLLAWGPLTYLGRISYGLYLWHILALILFPAPVALVVTVAVAACSYRFLEQPILRYGRAHTSMVAAPPTPPANSLAVLAEPVHQPHLYV